MRILRSVVPVVLVMSAAACGDDDVPSTEPSADPADASLPAPDDATVDGPWLLVSGTVGGSPVALVDGWDVTLTVDGSQLGGTAACNGYGGTVETTDGAFLVTDLGWTEMGCEPAVMDLEQAFLGSLDGITSHTVEGDVLTISGPAAEWVWERRFPVPDAEIVGTTWVLDTYLRGGAATNMPGIELATLTLGDDGTFTGSTGCRRLEGEWVTTGATVRFTSFAAIDDPTAGVCAPGAETLDGLVISVLEAGFTVEVEAGRMTLMAPGDEGLSYTAG
jgi:heat shock protein HslJ